MMSDQEVWGEGFNFYLGYVCFSISVIILFLPGKERLTGHSLWFEWNWWGVSIDPHFHLLTVTIWNSTFRGPFILVFKRLFDLSCWLLMQLLESYTFSFVSTQRIAHLDWAYDKHYLRTILIWGVLCSRILWFPDANFAPINLFVRSFML